LARSVSGTGPLPIPDSPQRGRRRNPRTARAVLKAALELLDDRDVGYRGLTMQAVAVRSGVSKATLYRWWPGKAHLVLDAYRSKTRRFTAVPTGDVRTDLRSHLGRLAYGLVHLDAGPVVIEMTLAAAGDASFGDLYREVLLGELRDALREILAGGRRRGEVRADADLEVAVDAAMGAIHHRLLLTKAPLDGPFTTALADLIISGLRPPGAA
jgi:AcrR family transcriptional regulator